MTKKLHIKTWGCQMNEYDSSKMADLLDATHGYQLTDVAEEADVLLLNTCSIRCLLYTSPSPRDGKSFISYAVFCLKKKKIKKKIIQNHNYD